MNKITTVYYKICCNKLPEKSERNIYRSLITNASTQWAYYLYMCTKTKYQSLEYDLFSKSHPKHEDIDVMVNPYLVEKALEKYIKSLTIGAIDVIQLHHSGLPIKDIKLFYDNRNNLSQVPELDKDVKSSLLAIINRESLTEINDSIFKFSTLIRKML